MRIFQGFLILIVTAILWLLPVTQGIYDFRTDVREDTFIVNTDLAETTAEVTLMRPIYNDNESSIVLYSNLSTDIPAIDEYTPNTRLLELSGLTANTTRILTTLYDEGVLNVHPALDIFMDIIPFIWMLILIVFPVVGLVAIIKRWV